jgi:glycosyltransferase involved in cell wall biosynthesis
MRVLHINLSKGWRGGERQTLLVMQGLCARGVENLLAARPSDELARRAAAEGFEVLPGGLGCLRANADLVHAHEARGLQFAAVWKLSHRQPVIATRRVYFRPSSGPLTRWKYGSADHVVAISQAVATVMQQWGTPADRLSIIHSAVDTADQSLAERVAELRARFKGKRVVGCIGALTPEKDHAMLLRAARRLQDARPDVMVVLVGDGELRGPLEVQARELGLSNLVFEGFQVDPYSYLKAFDVFALTSRAEGLGSSILDAFAYGVPVAATAAGAVTELVREGDTGLLCAIGDDEALARNIVRILDDAPLADHMKKGARELVMRDFTVDGMVTRYFDLYQQLAGENAAR